MVYAWCVHAGLREVDECGGEAMRVALDHDVLAGLDEVSVHDAPCVHAPHPARQPQQNVPCVLDHLAVRRTGLTRRLQSSGWVGVRVRVGVGMGVGVVVWGVG